MDGFGAGQGGSGGPPSGGGPPKPPSFLDAIAEIARGLGGGGRRMGSGPSGRIPKSSFGSGSAKPPRRACCRSGKAGKE